jgi:hypothetical protein
MFHTVNAAKCRQHVIHCSHRCNVTLKYKTQLCLFIPSHKNKDQLRSDDAFFSDNIHDDFTEIQYNTGIIHVVVVQTCNLSCPSKVALHDQGLLFSHENTDSILLVKITSLLNWPKNTLQIYVACKFFFHIPFQILSVLETIYINTGFNMTIIKIIITCTHAMP